MTIGKKLRLGLIGISAMALIAVLSIVGGTFNAEDSEADIVAGQYSMEVAVPTSAALATPFNVTVSIASGASSPDCSGAVPGVFGCYQGAQWYVQYDTGLINAGANCAPCPQVTLAAGVPGGICTSESVDSAQSRILLGCLSLGGADIDHQGDVFNISVQCQANGPAAFTLVAGASNTFVDDGGGNQPIHVHSDSVTCGTGATPTHTATPTNTPVATSTNTPTATATPCPTTGCTTPTVAPRDTNTPTPEGSETPATGETPGTGTTPPPTGSTPPPSGGTPGTGTGGGGGSGGVITGPDTGTGGGGAGSGSTIWIIAGLAVAGAVIIGGGAALRRAVRTSR